MSQQIGSRLGQYEIIGEIGRGGMAIVYRAFQPALDRYVAIKVLPPQFAFDETFVERFMLEARAAARLDHPNIVTIHDVGEHDGVYYIVMQELHGEPLSRLIQRGGQLSLERAANITQQIALALDYAHSHGFVHRDVKPANIIIGPDDKATLTDFGIAKAAEGTRLTQTGATLGTPEYMSPEQAKGEPVGPATDIYSLGLVAYEMLAGQAAFVANSTPAILYKQVHEQPRPARAVAPHLPESVDLALAGALAKEPSARDRTAGEFARSLLQVAAGLGLAAKPPVRSAEPVTLAALVEPHTLSAPAEPVTLAAPGVGLKRRSIWPLALAGAVLLIVVGLVLSAMRSGTAPTATPAPPAEEVAAEMSSPAAVASPRATPTPTSAPPTATPSPASPTPTPLVSPPANGKPEIVTGQAINLYTGPGREYQRLGQTIPSQRLEVVGRDSGMTWLVVCCIGGEPGWMEAGLVVMPEGVAQLPEATASRPTATATLVPTSTPTSVPTDTPSPSATPPPAPRLVDLAFVGAFDGVNGREIFAFYEGDPIPHQLTQAPGNDGYPAVSPNRKLIAFEAGRHGDEFGSDIWLMNSDGSDQRRLTADRGDEAQPSFSPDGQLIAFISTRNGASQIYLMAVDGSFVRHVPSPGWAFAPSFSPDGARLVFVATEDSQVYEVYTMALDGSDVRQITQSAAHNENPSFTADGRAIIFDSHPLDGPREIIRVDLDGNGWTNLTSSPTDDFQPVQAWDGSRIVFTRITDTKPHLWMMNSDGSNQRQLTDLGFIGEIDPAWSR